MPHQQESIRLFLESELRAACRSAIDRGARPADADDLLARRRRGLAEPADGHPDAGDDDE